MKEESRCLLRASPHWVMNSSHQLLASCIQCCFEQMPLCTLSGTHNWQYRLGAWARRSAFDHIPSHQSPTPPQQVKIILCCVWTTGPHLYCWVQCQNSTAQRSHICHKWFLDRFFSLLVPSLLSKQMRAFSRKWFSYLTKLTRKGWKQTQ